MQEKLAIEDEMDRWHHQLNDMSLSKLQDTVEDRGAWHDAVHEITELDMTEQQKQHHHPNNHTQ